MTKNKKILFIGPKTNVSDPANTGGAIVLFENLLQFCREHQIDHNIIDTNKFNYSGRIKAYISVIFQLISYLPHSSFVSFHSSRNYILLGLPILILCKLYKTPSSLRKFGGEAANVYNSSGYFKRKYLHFLYSNFDLIFMEMKFLVDFFKNINPNTFWFPNVRKSPSIQPKQKTYSKRFVFISHIKHSKGVDEILEASNRLDESYTIDLYGPISEEKYTEEYFKQFRANYKQALPSQEVMPTLNEYDVLLLPTFYKGEGYPGIIIEAFSLGIPVISTTLQGIKEIVSDQKTGILIEPKNVDQLVSAIEFFNDQNYPALSQAAAEKFNDFNTDIQTFIFLDHVNTSKK